MSDSHDHITPLQRIDTLTADYASALKELETLYDKYMDKIDQVTAQYLPHIKDLAMAVGTRKAELDAEIRGSREQFNAPRTLTMHGIVVGLKKGKGQIVIPNEERTIAKILSLRTKAEAELMIVQALTVSKQALVSLTAAELKQLGVSIVGTEDQVVIKPASSTTEALVAKLINDATPSAQEAKVA
jgi:hypothetical protein